MAFPDLLEKLCEKEEVDMEWILRQAILFFKNGCREDFIATPHLPTAAVNRGRTITAVDANGKIRQVRPDELTVSLSTLEKL